MLDYREAHLPQAQRALCDWAVKLTLDPARCGQHDIDILRNHGFEDEAIVIAAQVVGYFNYINRIAEGLGVDEEPWMNEVMPRNQWHARRARFT